MKRYGEDYETWIRWLKLIQNNVYRKGEKIGYEPWKSRIDDSDGPFHKLHYRTERHFVSCLPNRMGKDFSTAFEAASVLLMPRTHVLFVGALLRFSTITFELVCDFLLALLNDWDIPYKLSKSPKPELILNPGTLSESWLRCESFMNVSSLEGMELDLCAVCEAGDPATKFKWINEKMPTRLMNREGSFIIQSTNDVSNPEFKKFVNSVKLREDVMYVGKLATVPELEKWTSYDCPYIPLKEIEENKARMLPHVFAEKFLGEFVTISGRVMKSYDPKKHLIARSDLPFNDQSIVSWAGVDFGANDKTVVTVAILYQKKWYILEEYFTTQEPITNVIPYMKALQQKYNIKCFFCDHQKQTWLELVKVGLNAVAAKKNKVFDSVIHLDTMFFNNEIFIVKDECPNLQEELIFYSWSEKINEPIDSYNHSVDTLRYLIDSVIDDDLSFKFIVPKLDVNSCRNYLPIGLRNIKGF